MPYSIKQLANLAGISVRTLQYYDTEGLLVAQRNNNNYRTYTDQDLLRLQQILFYRELDFTIAEIKTILNNPRFDLRQALRQHKKIIVLKQKRLNKLIATINSTLTAINNNEPMDNKNMYAAFDDSTIHQYAQEAKERWGHTDAYAQSQKRYAAMTPQQLAQYQEEQDKLMRAIVAAMTNGPTSPVVQGLIDQHYNSLRTWYEPTKELYQGLAEMYVQDERFARYFRKYHTDLPNFMHQAMLHYIAY